MSNLLALAVDAHGGLDRWKKIKAIRIEASITGAIWFVKGRGDVLKDVVLTVETQKQRVVIDLLRQEKRATFEPNRIVMETAFGTSIETRDDPEKAFVGQVQDTPWDDIDVAYFCGEALWTYLNVPFLYASEGFSSQEIAPLQIDGEIWRRLEVMFPNKIKSHTKRQISCFGPDGLLRRHDYTVDILGGGTGLNYASEYRTFDGIVIPTKRRVYAYTGDYQIVREPLLVAIDMTKVTLSY